MKNSKILATILTLALALALMAPAVFAAPVESDGSAGIKWQASGFEPYEPPVNPPTDPDPEDEWFENFGLANDDLYFGEHKIALTDRTYDSVDYTGETYGRLLGYGAKNGTVDAYTISMEISPFSYNKTGVGATETMEGFRLKLLKEASSDNNATKDIIFTYGGTEIAATYPADNNLVNMFTVPERALSAVNFSGNLKVLQDTVDDDVTNASATITWYASPVVLP